MTIQSQLDQVLALFDLPDTPLNGVLVAEHCYAFMKEHGPAIRAAVGGVGETVAWWREDHVCHAHELTTADALADGYKPCVIKCEDCAWNASLCDTHGAVGGEAVAWRMLRANGKPYTGWKDLPVPEWASINVDDGMRLEYAYASPPATVDVGANDFLDGMITGDRKVNEQQKVYPERDPTEFVDYYMRHVDAMTSEELFGKGDIAIQLAWRDREIDQLRQRVAEVEAWADGPNGVKWYMAQTEQAEAKLALAEQLLREARGYIDDSYGPYQDICSRIDAAIDASGHESLPPYKEGG